MSGSCLIVGAGIAGLTAAGTLRDAGWPVTVADEGEAVGGRMATRRTGDACFDHGAQFFTARDPRFMARVQEWEAAGVVAPWFSDGDGHMRYRGIGGMDTIPAYMARGIDVRTSARIDCLEPADGGWRARDESGALYEAAVLILTPPAELSLALCEPFRSLLGRRLVHSLQSIHFDPCYCLMAVIDGPSNVPDPGLERLDDRVLLTVADNTRKGITSIVSALTLHATSRFTIEHWDDDQATVARLMLDAAAQYIPGPVTAWQLHRWRYSHPAQPDGLRFLMSKCPSPVYFAGDGFGGPRVESAFLSGLEAAQHVLGSAEGE
jgi:predicted NAD/FAD-dependent oxidoreductase